MCAIEMNLYLKKLLLVVTCSLVFFQAPAQTTRTPLEDMVNAIKTNRVQDMLKYFDNTVPVTINNNQTIYSHNQAEVVLQDFFDKNNPKDFIVTDNGAPNASSKFVIGSFATPSAKYNVYILMRLKDGLYVVQEIRLNKE